MARIRCDRGQGTVEWVALVLLVSLALTAIATISGLRAPAVALAEAIVTKLECAVGLGDFCETEAEALAAAYGPEVARLVADHAPAILYEEGMTELPVDYRDCRDDPCSLASGSGAVWRTDGGDRAVAFTHVIDCRAAARRRAQAAGARCDAERSGSLYLQYWLYWPDSQTDPWGERGYHRDDWESFQVRIGREVSARASSHHSYNYRGGIANWPSDAGVLRKAGWGPYLGQWHVSAGSHAGRVAGDSDSGRFTPARRLRLIPIEEIAAAGRDDGLFAIAPPWLKDVYADPESDRT